MQIFEGEAARLSFFFYERPLSWYAKENDDGLQIPGGLTVKG